MSEEEKILYYNTDHFLGVNLNEDQMSALKDMFEHAGWDILKKSLKQLQDRSIEVGMNRLVDEAAQGEARHTYSMCLSFLGLEENCNVALREGSFETEEE